MDRHQVLLAKGDAILTEVALPAGARACRNLQAEEGITMDRAPVSSHRNPETGAVIEVRPAEASCRLRRRRPRRRRETETSVAARAGAELTWSGPGFWRRRGSPRNRPVSRTRRERF